MSDDLALLVLADDRTGALEAAGECANAGLVTVMTPFDSDEFQSIFAVSSGTVSFSLSGPQESENVGAPSTGILTTGFSHPSYCSRLWSP